MERKITDGIRKRNTPPIQLQKKVAIKPLSAETIPIPAVPERSTIPLHPQPAAKSRQAPRKAPEPIIIPEPVADKALLSDEVEEDEPLLHMPTAEKREIYREVSGLSRLGTLRGIPGTMRRHSVALSAAGVLGIVGLTFLLLSTVFARVTVDIKPRIETIALQHISVAFDTSVSQTLIPQKVIPGEKFDFTQSAKDEFLATGKQHIEDRARGTVKIYNSFSSTPQNLVINTRFLADNGVLFRLAKTITIPGAKIDQGKIVPQFVEAELVADKAGEGANLSGTPTLKIPGFKGSPKYDAFYAASSGFSGGFRGEAVVATADDIKKAQEQMTKRVYDNLRQEMARKVPSGFKVIDALEEIKITKVDAPKENTRGDRFMVTAGAVGRLIVFREKDVVDLLSQLSIKEDATKIFVPGSAALTYQIRAIDFEKGRADILVDGEMKIKSVIPGAELAGILQGKKEGTLIEALKNRPDIASFRLSFFPPWIASAPSDLQKIKVITE